VTFPPLLEFKGISKAFGDHLANHNVTFSVEAGSFHGIVGENGAGKSTIMNILYGLIPADSGHILFQGKPVRFSNPQQAIEAGIGMVHQHFMQVPSLTVWENLILGFEPRPFPWQPNQLIQDLSHLRDQFGFTVDLEKPIEQLGVGQQQQVELLKLLYRRSNVLILDEPTAVLSPQECDHLFEKLHLLQKNGHTLILISHRIKDILAHTDKVTVMRHGQTVTTESTHSLTPDSLAALIMGEARHPWIKPFLKQQGEPVLEVQAISTDCSRENNLTELSFNLMPGEILGIAGMEGQGQELLVEVLTQQIAFSGSIRLLGKPLGEWGPYEQRQHGFSLIPMNRIEEALIPEMSLAENLILGHHREASYVNRGWLNQRALEQECTDRTRRFDIRPSDIHRPVKLLSGGNQQKLVIARETDRKVKLLVACHPSRGVDIRSSDAIYQNFFSLAQEGAAILLISSDLDELLLLSTRIVVMRKGRLVFFTAPQNTSLKELGLWMTGAQE